VCFVESEIFMCFVGSNLYVLFEERASEREREREREREDLDLLKSVEVCNNKLLKRERKSPICS